MKDMPTDDPPGLCVPCVPKREDPRDVLVGLPSIDTSTQIVVGTGSIRRKMQLRQLKPGLVVEGIRGNVDTRIQKQRDGQYDAVVLAAAGLHRLGRAMN